MRLTTSDGRFAIANFQKKDHRWREECIAGLGAHCNNKSANYFTMKSWFPIKTKETTLSRNTHLVLLLFTQWAHTSSFYDTVGLYPLIYLHSGHHPRHVLYTDCPASVPPLLAQWAHTSSFYDRVGLHLLFLTQWAPPSKSAVHTLSSLISLCPLCKKMGGIGPLCQKMRRYGTTVQVREKMKLGSLCTVDGFGGAPCISKWGYRPTVT